MGRGKSNDGTGEVARLESQIEAARDQLAANIDALAARVAPQVLAEDAKSRARSVVFNPDGSLKNDRVYKIAAVVGVLVVIRVWRAKR